MKEAQLRWLSFSETQSEIANGRRESERWKVEGPQAANGTSPGRSDSTRYIETSEGKVRKELK